MPKRLVELAYISNSMLGDDPVQALESLGAILRDSRARNALLGITGLLLFDWARFAQTLEGPADAVDALFAAIQVDPRHRNVALLRRRERRERALTKWSMACLVIDKVAGIDGAIAVTGGGLIGQIVTTDAIHHGRKMAMVLQKWARRSGVDGGGCEPAVG